MYIFYLYTDFNGNEYVLVLKHKGDYKFKVFVFSYNKKSLSSSISHLFDKKNKFSPLYISRINNYNYMKVAQEIFETIVEKAGESNITAIVLKKQISDVISNIKGIF